MFWWGVVFDEGMLGIDTECCMFVRLWVSKLLWPPVTTSLLIISVILCTQQYTLLTGYSGLFSITTVVCLGLGFFWLSFNIYIWFQWNNCYICTCRVYDKHIWLKTVLYQIFLILCVSSCWKCWYWLQCLIFRSSEIMQMTCLTYWL